MKIQKDIEQYLEVLRKYMGAFDPEKALSTTVEKLRKDYAETMELGGGYVLPEGIRRTEFSVETEDHQKIECLWYERKEAPVHGPAVVYAHGGGMIIGSARYAEQTVVQYVQKTGIPFFSVDYRLAPEFTGGTAAKDVFAAVCFLREHAEQLQADPARIAVMGDSGGGGIAAACAVLCRDRGVPLAKQILIYPMLDDRTDGNDERDRLNLFWNHPLNRFAWTQILGDRRGSADVSCLEAPARNTDFAGLADAYIDVGDLDIFREEDIFYAQSLLVAGVHCELHVYPGCPHGFDSMPVKSAEQAMENRLHVLRSL